MDAKKIEDDFTLAGTYMDSELSEDDIKLLAELDAIDVSTAEMAVEFTDRDLVHNSMLMGRMAKLKGHANNVDCCSYTYVINVYQKDPAASTFKYTRVYEFADNVSISLMELFSTQGCNFIKRSTTQCFGADELHNPNIELEQRAVYVYDLIVPEGFDIDATHYYYRESITCFDPWETSPEAWEPTLREGWVDTFDELNGSMNFETNELYHLKMTNTTPNVLNTRNAISMIGIKEKKDDPTVIFKTQDI